MTSEELRMILGISGVVAKIKGDELLVEVCIFCSNAKWNLELNAEKGVFRCWACRTGGRLDKFLEQLTGERYKIQPQFARDRKIVPVQVGDRPQEFKTRPIIEVPSACTYLTDRGYDAEVVRTFGLTVCVEEGHELYGRIVIPIRDYWTGNVLGWTGRSYTGGWPKYMSMLPTMMVTGWRAQGRTTPAVVVEGHLDGIAAHRAGFSAAVIGGISINDLSEWSARIQPEQWIVVMLDGDAPEAAERLYWNIAAVRTTARLGLVTLEQESDPSNVGPVAIKRLVEAAISSSDGTSQDGGSTLVE